MTDAVHYWLQAGTITRNKNERRNNWAQTHNNGSTLCDGAANSFYSDRGVCVPVVHVVSTYLCEPVQLKGEQHGDKLYSSS